MAFGLFLWLHFIVYDYCDGRDGPTYSRCISASGEPLCSIRSPSNLGSSPQSGLGIHEEQNIRNVLKFKTICDISSKDERSDDSVDNLHSS